MNNKAIIIFTSIFLITGSIYLSIMSWNAIKTHDYIGVSEEQRHSITVVGDGEVVGIPDTATVQLGYMIEKKTVAEAQKENSLKMNEIIKKLKGDLKIDEKDIKTNSYSISPRYDWSDGKQTLKGYQVSQNLVVKIRDLEKISTVLDEAGSLDLNQIGGLSFEIDNPDELESEAREIAIKAAKEKAETLADIAGVKLGRIISFSEFNSRPSPVYASYKTMDMAEGMGGSAPEIQAGSTEIKITATVEYEIL